MEYTQILEENLSTILGLIREDVFKDENVREFVKSDKELNELLHKQEELLKEYLYSFEDDSAVDENYCWNFYKDLKIPYSVVYKSLQTLKISLMKLIMENLDDKFQIIEVEKYVNYLLDSIAKVYIKKDIHKIKDVNKSTFKKYLLFRAHLEWLNSVIESIVEDDLTKFPIMSSEDCIFNKYLNYPESQMVCMDINLCTNLHDVHHLIHKSANTFYLFYKKKEFVQAYIVFKELLESVMKFSKIITELYFLAYGNIEEALFKYIELLLYKSEIPIYLTMVDIEKLKSLNTNFGELTINKVLKEIDEKIKEVSLKKEENIIVAKSLTADYYLLSVDLEEKVIEDITKVIYSIVNDKFSVDFKEVTIKSIVVTLSLNGFYGKNRDDLTKLVFHIKDKAKNKKGSYLVNSIEEKEELKHWLDKSYSDINFINRALKNESIEAVFQPIYNIKTGKIDIIEALCRIKDESGKLIPAGVFIDTIYSINKIEELDRLMLKKLLEYEKEIKMVADTLFINISYKSILDSRYKLEFENFIKKFGSSRVVFELTEQSIVENINEILRLHKEYDVHFAVDDFGSGYSSLKTVSDLAREGVLKVLKIDESLVKNINIDKFDRKVIDIIGKLSNALDLKSVGEFIENKEVYEKLKAYGITYAQGYYLSRPKLIDELLVEQINGLSSVAGL